MTITITQKCDGCGKERQLDPKVLLANSTQIGGWRPVPGGKEGDLCFACCEQIVIALRNHFGGSIVRS